VYVRGECKIETNGDLLAYFRVLSSFGGFFFCGFLVFLQRLLLELISLSPPFVPFFFPSLFVGRTGKTVVPFYFVSRCNLETT